MTISENKRPIRCSMSLNYFSPWNLKIRPPQGKDDCRSTKSNRKCHRKSTIIRSKKRNNRLGSPPKSFSQNNNQQKRISFGNMMRMSRRRIFSTFRNDRRHEFNNNGYDYDTHTDESIFIARKKEKPCPHNLRQNQAAGIY